MKFPKTNSLESWLKEYKRKHPFKSRWINLKIQIRIYFIELRYKLSKTNIEEWIDNQIFRISDNGNGKLSIRLLYLAWSIRPKYITSLTDGDYEQYQTKTPENFYKCYLRGIVWKLNFRSHCKDRKFGVFFYRPDVPSHT